MAAAGRCQRQGDGAAPGTILVMSFDSGSDLPDQIIRQILGKAAEVAGEVRELFESVDSRRELMRHQLILASRILHTDQLPKVSAPMCCAIDGGAAVEKGLGMDTALAVAVGVEGLGGVGLWKETPFAAWQKTLQHEGDATGSTCRAVMTTLELSLLANAPHPVVLLDGSHLTPVISLNAALSIRDDGLRQELAENFAHYKTAEALHAAMFNPEIVALVKYDGTRDLGETWLGGQLKLDDRTTMTLLLQADEYTEPVPLGLTQKSKRNWIAKEIQKLTPSDAIREEVREAVNEAVSQVRTDGLFATYYKPQPWSPAYRLEIKKEIAQTPERLAQVFAVLKAQVISPEIREPYPQYVADRMAKSVGDALVALRTAVHYDLADAGLSEYVALVAHSYRTEAL